MSSRRIVVSVQVSLDGRTARGDGELDWLVVKDELHAHFVAEHSKAGMFLYGRRTYEGTAGYVTEFADRDLVDEYQIYVHPVALGTGPSLLQNVNQRQGLSLIGSQIFDETVVKLTYRRTNRA